MNNPETDIAPNEKTVTPTKLEPKVVGVALVALFGIIGPMIDSTVVNVAVKVIGIDLKADIGMLSWISTAYVLVMGIAVPLSGWAANRFKAKSVYLVAMFLFLVGSVLCAVSPNILALIFSRAVQGVGAGIMLPLYQTILTRMVRPEQRIQLMTIVSIPAIVFPVIGPMIGGAIVDNLPWQWIFWINVPLVLLAMLLNYFKLPSEFALQPELKFDIRGLTLLSLSFILLISGITNLSHATTEKPTASLILLGLGLATLAFFILYSKRTKSEPCLNLNLFKKRSFTLSEIGAGLCGMVSTGTLFILPLYFQYEMDLDPLGAGLAVGVSGVGMLVTRPFVDKLVGRFGSKSVIIAAWILTLAGTLPLCFLSCDQGLAVILVIIFFRGMGMGTVWIPLSTMSYNGLDKIEMSHASTITNIVLQIGSAMGTAILAIVLSYGLTNHLSERYLLSSFQITFGVAAGITLLALISSLFLKETDTK